MPPDPDLYQTPAKYLTTLSIIHRALIIGQVLFIIVAIALTKKIMINVRFMDDPLVFIVPIVAIGGFIASNLLYKRKLNQISKVQSLRSKLMDYQTAFIIRCAALEAPSLLGIVAFLITGILFFLMISVLLIGYFIYIKPTRENITEALDLNYPERELFNQLHTVLK